MSPATQESNIKNKCHKLTQFHVSRFFFKLDNNVDKTLNSQTKFIICRSFFRMHLYIFYLFLYLDLFI